MEQGLPLRTARRNGRASIYFGFDALSKRFARARRAKGFRRVHRRRRAAELDEFRASPEGAGNSSDAGFGCRGRLGFTSGDDDIDAVGRHPGLDRSLNADSLQHNGRRRGARVPGIHDEGGCRPPRASRGQCVGFREPELVAVDEGTMLKSTGSFASIAYFLGSFIVCLTVAIVSATEVPSGRVRRHRPLPGSHSIVRRPFLRPRPARIFTCTGA